MKERPMLFNGDMVRAILDGRKTQTRRPMKMQPDHRHRRIDFENGYLLESVQRNGCWHVEQKQTCPFGIPGDRIWVRETWNVNGLAWGQSIEFSKISSPDAFHYRATDDGGWKPYWGKWRPSIHMPRWACRIVLEITDVRVQRVQEISEEDAIKEGISDSRHPDDCCGGLGISPKGIFSNLWDSCYGKSDFSWDKNPWVWALTFKRVEDETK